MSAFLEFVSFLEDDNRYNDEISNVHYYFNGLSNDVSHFAVVQLFIISTCLRYVDISGFCQFSQGLQ